MGRDFEHIKNLKWETFMEKLQTSNMSPPESCYGIWYHPEINKFIDEDGFIMHDFHDLFDVWQLDQWKKQKRLFQWLPIIIIRR